MEIIPISGNIENVTKVKNLEYYITVWDQIKNTEFGRIHISVCIELAAILVECHRIDLLSLFLSNLTKKHLDELIHHEPFLHSYIALKFYKKEYNEVYSLLRDGKFSNKEGLLEFWDQAHYKEKEEKIGRPLTPLIRFRVRQRNPPPPSICIGGERPSSKLNENAVNILKGWFSEHSTCPYPTHTEKEKLAEEAKLSVYQIKTWFANARRRWKIRTKRLSRKTQERSGKKDVGVKVSLNKPTRFNTGNVDVPSIKEEKYHAKLSNHPDIECVKDSLETQPGRTQSFNVREKHTRPNLQPNSSMFPDGINRLLNQNMYHKHIDESHISPFSQVPFPPSSLPIVPPHTEYDSLPIENNHNSQYITLRNINDRELRNELRPTSYISLPPVETRLGTNCNSINSSPFIPNHEPNGYCMTKTAWMPSIPASNNIQCYPNIQGHLGLPPITTTFFDEPSLEKSTFSSANTANGSCQMSHMAPPLTESMPSLRLSTLPRPPMRLSTLPRPPLPETVPVSSESSESDSTTYLSDRRRKSFRPLRDVFISGRNYGATEEAMMLLDGRPKRGRQETEAVRNEIAQVLLDLSNTQSQSSE